MSEGIGGTIRGGTEPGTREVVVGIDCVSLGRAVIAKHSTASRA